MGFEPAEFGMRYRHKDSNPAKVITLSFCEKQENSKKQAENKQKVQGVRFTPSFKPSNRIYPRMAVEPLGC